MENKHFYWLKALRQKYSYKELITALKAINCQLKEKSLQCEFKRIENYCKRKTKKTYDYQNCCMPQEKWTKKQELKIENDKLKIIKKGIGS